ASNQSGCVSNVTYPTQSTPATPAGVADVLSGQNFYAGGAMLTGTMATRTLSAASTTVSAGYYAATDLATVDADLTAANLLSTATIFGITGSVTACNGSNQTGCVSSATFPTQSTPATPAAAANVMSGKNFYAGGAVVTGTMPTQTLTNTTTTVSAGYYAATDLATVDTDLTAANILSTATIFGITGSVTACNGSNQTDCVSSATFPTQSTPATPAGAADVLSGKHFYAGGAVVTGTMTDRGTFDSAVSFPGAGYYAAPGSSGGPAAANICSATTILGVAGSATCGGIVMTSNAFRNQATTAISQLVETSTYAGATLPAGYRDVPTIATDDDGFVSPGITSSQVTLPTHSTGSPPTGNCGTTQASIAARISDCVTVQGVNATWDGATQGNAGQGAWKLVTRAGLNQEVWQDQRTGLLWSSILTNTNNWCVAAGNAEAADPSNYCNSTLIQTSYPTAQSWCAEVGPTAMMEAPGSGEIWTSATYHLAKGGMGNASSPSVRWRLPTLYDYEQANVNGIRFVMPDMLAVPGWTDEWSASLYAMDRSYAWTFQGGFGYTTWSMRTGVTTHSMSVRCVGR
ncbi:hypothetical protein WDW37_08990, partial [Bdellovibrionota bacterium FG-1]